MPSVAEIPNKLPLVSTTAAWRGEMKAAREARRMTQDDLAAAVGVSQPVIQGLEKGTQETSRSVLRICEVLRIPPPKRYQDDAEERWAVAGARLRERMPSLFASQLQSVEAMVKAFEKSKRTEDE